MLCGSSSVGRASAFQADCREFESRLPLIKKESQCGSFLFNYFPSKMIGKLFSFANSKNHAGHSFKELTFATTPLT